MKLILDLKQETVSNMQGYCAQHDISVNELVESLFNKHVQHPASIIDELYQRDKSLEGLNDFSEMLTHYLNEAIYDIEESSLSDEAYTTDLPMAEVLKVLNRDIVKEQHVLTRLYKTYKDMIK